MTPSQRRDQATPDVRDKRILRDLWRVAFRQWRTPRTMVRNLRFALGMWIGDFDYAGKDR